MTEKESMKIVSSIIAAYPNYRLPDIDAAVKVWQDALEGCTYEQASMALKTYIRTDTSGFAPSPGRIVDLVFRMTVPEELDELTAWSLVSTALRRSAYYSEEEFAKLPPLVQKAVGAPSQLRTWAMDENYNESVASSNFMRTYRTAVARHKEEEKIPPQVKKLMQDIGDKSAAKQIPVH